MKAARRRREIFRITHARFAIFSVKIAPNTAVLGEFCRKSPHITSKTSKFSQRLRRRQPFVFLCCPVVLLDPNLDAENPLVFKMANN